MTQAIDTWDHVMNDHYDDYDMDYERREAIDRQFPTIVPSTQWVALNENGKRVVARSIPAGQTVYVSGGGATIVVMDDVGENATLIARGGGATIQVAGHIGAGARIGAAGGGATIVATDGVDPTAQLVAFGGGAKVMIA